MRNFLLPSIILAFFALVPFAEEVEDTTRAEARLDVMRVDPYIFPTPDGFKAYVVSGFVRPAEGSGGMRGMQSVCVLVSDENLMPVVGAELSVVEYAPGTAALLQMREEYNEFSKKLVGIYMQMPELSFFRLLDELSIEEQARIFAMMKAEDLARYLGMIGPEKARILTKLLAKQREIAAVYVSAESKSWAALD